MSVLTAHPYLLEEGDLIVAQVEALNDIGFSVPSNINTDGARV